MRVVLDTNVFISGIFFGGIPSKILTAWLNKNITLIVSPAILYESRRVLLELSARFKIQDGSGILELLTVNSTLVSDTELPEQVCTDRDDDKFLACAFAGKAKIICSGDKALLKTSGYKGIAVLTPHVFYRDHISG